MAVSIDVGGVTHTVNIDGWDGMSDTQKSAAVEDVHSHFSPSFKDDLVGGVHDLASGLSQTANAIGGVANRNGYTGIGDAATTTGKFLAAHTPDNPDSPAPDVGAALKEGRYSDLPGAIAHTAVRSLPSVAPMLAAGAIPGVGPVLAGGIAGAESLGPTAYQRAQNNGRAEPDTSDVVGALPSTAVNAVAGAYLPGGGASKLAKPFIEAGTGAVMDASNQLGGSVGTDAGASFDPYQTAGTGLTQGAIGAGRQIAPMAKAGVKSAADGVMSRLGDQPVSVEDAASMSRVGKAYDAQLEAVNGTRGGSTRPTDVLNSLKAENLSRTRSYGRELADAGIMSPELFKTFGATLDQALRHNNEITEGGVEASSLFDDLKNSGIQPDALQPLLNGIRDQNTLSKQSFLKNQTGPFRQLGQGISQLAAIGLPLSHGNIPGAAMAYLGHGIVGKAGGIIGGALDSALGTATPKVLLQRMAADRYLKAQGADAGPNTLGSLSDASKSVQGLVQQQADQKAAADLAAKFAAPPGKPLKPPPIQAPEVQAPLVGVPLKPPPIQAPQAPDNGVPMRAPLKPPPIPPRQLTVDALAQQKVDKFVKDNSVTLAAADKLPTDTVHQDSVAGQAAMVAALDRAKAVLNRGNSASNDLRDRMLVGNPASDLMGHGDTPQSYKTEPTPRTPQTPTAPHQAPPMAPVGSPVSSPVVSGPAPALNPATPATQGRPWERYVGKTMPHLTRGQVQAGVNAVHTPEMAAHINGSMGGVDAAHLQPVIEHLQASHPGVNGTQEIAMPRQWEAAKAAYQSDVADKAAEARAVGLPDTSAALAEVGLTKGQGAKADVRDAHLATILDAARRSQAASLFSKRLMNHGPK